MKYPSLFVLLTLIWFVSGCQYNEYHLNRESDKILAESVTTKLFELEKEELYDEAFFALFHDEFFKATSKEQLKNNFLSNDSTIGKLKAFSLHDWKTKVSDDPEYTSIYNLVYSAKYELDDEVIIKLSLIKIDEELKIVSYNINSNNFK